MKAQDIRHIQNPFKKIVNIIKPDNDKLFNMLFNLIQQFIDKVKIPSLNDISSNPKQTGIDVSAYAGANSYLYTLIRLYRFFKLEEMKSKENQQKMQSSINAQDQISTKLKDPDFYLGLAIEQYTLTSKFIEKRKKRQKVFSFYMSETCTWLCGMHLGYIKRDHDKFRYNQMKLIECYNYYKEVKHELQVQLLYGIPGFLYTILQAQHYYDTLQEELFRTNFKNISKSLTIDIVNIGITAYEKQVKGKVNLQKLPADFRLFYTFHKKQYLGGAHGLGGNLNIILLSMKMNDFSESLQIFCNVISCSIKFLTKFFINKNFTTSTSSQKTKLVHFCHGAPGIVSCLARFQLMFPELGIQMAIPEIIKASLDHIWNYGILRKGFGLCHGISGNAYSFIYPAIQEVLPEEAQENRRKATLFALLREEKEVMNEIKEYHFSDRHIKGISDSPYSLMLGVAGDICFTTDLLEGTARFPGFDF